jgi:hypothetical protein
MGLWRFDKLYLLTWAYTKPTQSGKCIIGAPLVLGRAAGNLDSQNSPRPGLGGSHHLPPYNILYASPHGPHPNDFLSRDSQVGVPKLQKLGLPQLWGTITLRVNLQWRWGLKQSCNPHRELSNSMLQATYMQGNWVDSLLLVVESQIVNLTLDLSFGHNLCFRCPNGWCEPILDIYVPRSFQWYKERFKPLRFDRCNRLLRIWEFTRTPTPKVEPLGGVRVPHTLSHSQEYVVWLPVSFLARNLANPCLGHEPKARVTTLYNYKWIIN